MMDRIGYYLLKFAFATLAAASVNEKMSESWVFMLLP